MKTLTPLENTRHIYDLVALCVQYGVTKAVVCPGSRCAPLLIGFGKHPHVETISITDERSAGFVGLGLAQELNQPVVLVSTSGTAAQNFAPAVTEAFYQNVPLIILTADRPPQWIDQWDGQTIRQKNLYIDHVKGSFVYDKNNLDVGRKGLELALNEAQGPVHLNIPIREPFYPEHDANFAEIRVPAAPPSKSEAGGKITGIKSQDIDDGIWEDLKAQLDRAEKVMILAGQGEPNPELVDLLNQINIPIVGDVISNLHGVEGIINTPDLLFKSLGTVRQSSWDGQAKSPEDLKPDFLITIGRSVISKNLKLYLRKHKPKSHWHIGVGMVGDPFQSLTRVVEVGPNQLFREWIERKIRVNNQNQYLKALTDVQKNVDIDLKFKLKNADFNYFTAVNMIIGNLPEGSVLHLGNSMPVRIANFIGVSNSRVDVWANRGTSGIDGIVSTAVGHGLGDPDRYHTLIVGDISFFYDRNGLWLNGDSPTNLRIVVLNDGGGGIFNMIPGPSNQGDLTPLFTTPHDRTAELTAKEFGLDYHNASSFEELEKLTRWTGGILEIFTDMGKNLETYKGLTAEDAKGEKIVD